jgi:hypothetical protein
MHVLANGVPSGAGMPALQPALQGAHCARKPAMKKKPTGFVAVCQCGVAVGALDLERSELSDVSRLLGKWLMDGCVVHPQFTHTWAARLEPCKCGQQPNTPISGGTSAA